MHMKICSRYPFPKSLSSGRDLPSLRSKTHVTDFYLVTIFEGVRAYEKRDLSYLCSKQVVLRKVLRFNVLYVCRWV